MAELNISEIGGGRALRRVMLAGVVVMAVFLGGFGAWAALAPLDSAAIARGVVVVEGQRKTVQHLEGGIVGEILVADGQEVEAGQLLVRLDDTKARTQLQRLRMRHRAAVARKSRLAAEQDDIDWIDFPGWLEKEAKESPNVGRLLFSEQSVFVARKRSREGEVAILERQVAQLEDEIAGREGEIAAQQEQLALIDDELEGLRQLYEKGLLERPRLMELERRAAELRGQIARGRAQVASAHQKVAETEQQIAEIDTKRVNEAVAELRDAQELVFDLEEEMVEVADVLERTEIRAPISGRIVDLDIHTTGGTIDPRQALMDIVPRDKGLVVEARVDPDDVESLRPGLKTQVRLTAFSHRRTRPLEGEVLSISADRLEDERSGESYFLGRIAIDEERLTELSEPMIPGMQAEVSIVTGERTFFDYMVSPLTESFGRAFREP